MGKVYIVALGTCEGIQEIRSIHKTYNNALVAFKKLCDDLITQNEEMIDHELINGHGERWINRFYNQIKILRTYNPEYISNELYPGETPVIIDKELNK